MTRMYVRRLTTSGVDDSDSVQTIQADLGVDYTLGDVEVMCPQGVRFLPRGESEGVLLCPDGRVNQGVAVGVRDPEDMPSGTSAEGTGGLYYQGQFRVFLDAAGGVVLCGDVDSGREATDFVSVDSKVQAELESIRSTLDALVTTFNAHTHPETGSVTGPTTTPGVAPAAVGLTASDLVRIPNSPA